MIRTLFGPPKNGNPGIVPPWLKSRRPVSDSLEAPKSVSDVERILLHNGWAEVDTDLPARG